MFLRVGILVASTAAWALSSEGATVFWDPASGGNGHYYEVVFCPGTPQPQPCSWEEARTSAQARGAGWDLVTLASLEENAFVEALFANDIKFFNIFRANINSGPWIGAVHVGPGTRNYQWVTGEQFSFTDWGPSEPFGNGDRISYADFAPPFGDGSAIAWNDIGSGRADGPIAFIVESSGPSLNAAVSAASFDGSVIAPGQIVSLFGVGLADGIVEATTLPLPVILGGTEVRIIDRLGLQHPGQFFFVSPGQINLLVPSETALGDATVKVRRAQGPEALLNIHVAAVAPGLFTANVTGEGVAAGFSLHVLADGSRLTALLFSLDAATKSFVPAPINLGTENDQVFLLLFGTGIRGASNPPTVLIGGEVANVLYAGPHEEFVGLDQVNVGPIPRQLAGRGEVNVLLFADGIQANPVVVGMR
jgi:uncharacterized protein (TIGR03437 family)